MNKLTAMIVSILFTVSLAVPFAAFAGDPMAKSKTSATSKKADKAAMKGKADASGAAKKRLPIAMKTLKMPKRKTKPATKPLRKKANNFSGF